MKDCFNCSTHFTCPKHFNARPRRKIIGVKISDDFGETWKIRALCEDCIKNFEPPKMVKREIEAGALTCDFCGAVNNVYRKRRVKGSFTALIYVE